MLEDTQPQKLKKKLCTKFLYFIVFWMKKKYTQKRKFYNFDPAARVPGASKLPQTK